MKARLPTGPGNQSALQNEGTFLNYETGCEISYWKMKQIIAVDLIHEDGMQNKFVLRASFEKENCDINLMVQFKTLQF